MDGVRQRPSAKPACVVRRKSRVSDMNSRVTGLHYSMPMDNIASVMQHGILCCERAASTDKSWPKALLSNCPLDGGAKRQPVGHQKPNLLDTDAKPIG